MHVWDFLSLVGKLWPRRPEPVRHVSVPSILMHVRSPLFSFIVGRVWPCRPERVCHVSVLRDGCLPY